MGLSTDYGWLLADDGRGSGQLGDLCALRVQIRLDGPAPGGCWAEEDVC